MPIKLPPCLYRPTRPILPGILTLPVRTVILMIVLTGLAGHPLWASSVLTNRVYTQYKSPDVCRGIFLSHTFDEKLYRSVYLKRRILVTLA